MWQPFTGAGAKVDHILFGKAFQPGSVNYDSPVAANYAAARRFLPETAAIWTALVERFLAGGHPARVLDLGCGTGRFSSLFAGRFEAQVIGLDPSFPMLQVAAAGSGRANLFYANARSEHLPLSDSCCDLAWLSQVLHHIADRDACARELRRVVRPGGHVLIRGTFGDRLDGFPAFLRFFPGTRSVMETFPTLDQVMDGFREAGFAVESLQAVAQKTCDNLAQFAARTRLRADSSLLLLPDAEFEKCQKALECEARAATPTPVIETLDLLALRAPAA